MSSPLSLRNLGIVTFSTVRLFLSLSLSPPNARPLLFSTNPIREGRNRIIEVTDRAVEESGGEKAQRGVRPGVRVESRGGFCRVDRSQESETFRAQRAIRPKETQRSAFFPNLIVRSLAKLRRARISPRLTGTRRLIDARMRFEIANVMGEKRRASEREREREGERRDTSYP